MSRSLKKLSNALCRFCHEQEGAAASEYAVILGVLIVVALGAIALFGVSLSDTTSAVYSGLSTGTDTGNTSFGPGTFRTGTTVEIP